MANNANAICIIMFGNQLLDYRLSKTDKFRGALLSMHIQTLFACTGLG
jgi:hypothetical protein